jgi:hypothetical protein
MLLAALALTIILVSIRYHTQRRRVAGFILVTAGVALAIVGVLEILEGVDPERWGAFLVLAFIALLGPAIIGAVTALVVLARTPRERPDA